MSLHVRSSPGCLDNPAIHFPDPPEKGLWTKQLSSASHTEEISSSSPSPLKGGSVFGLNKLHLSLLKWLIPVEDGEFVFKTDPCGADLERPSDVCGVGLTTPGTGGGGPLQPQRTATFSQ